MGVVDLDAERRARAEAAGDECAVILNGRRYALKTELPLQVAPVWRELVADIARDDRKPDDPPPDAGPYLRLILQDRADAEELMATGVTFRDLIAMSKAWGFTAGESKASASSSKKNGKTSRPTSKRTTTKT